MAGGQRIHSREDIAQKNGNSFCLQQAGFVFIDGVFNAFFLNGFLPNYVHHTGWWWVPCTFLVWSRVLFSGWKIRCFWTWHISWWIPQRVFVFCFFLPHFAKEPIDFYRCPCDKNNMKRTNVTRFLKYFEDILDKQSS